MAYIRDMKIHKWLEPLLLVCCFGLVYFWPMQAAPLPVFWDEFNTLDGSLYAVRGFDLLISVILVLIASHYLIPQKPDASSLIKLTLFCIGILAVAGLVEAAWDQLTLWVFNLPTAAGEVSDKMLAYPQRESLDLTILLGNSLVLSGGLVYGLILDWNRRLRQQAQLERKHLEAEVNYLRSQINPHFLFNTLNNIFAITQRNEDQEGSDALLRLAGLMRYMLYESSGSEIRLNQEVEHLRNYRDLMLLKYARKHPPELSFEVDLIPDSCRVAPLILLPFVENAFKHGINNQGQGSIQVKLKLEANTLDFQVINTVFKERRPDVEHPGIGLENVRQRLELIYPGKHDLQIVNGSDSFQIHLRVTL